MSGGGKGGGKVDTSAATAATDKSLALQKEIYDKNTQLVQPWYQAGGAAQSKLLDLLGLSGGSAMKTREQLVAELTPQYTTTIGGNQAGTTTAAKTGSQASAGDYALALQQARTALQGSASRNDPAIVEKYANNLLRAKFGSDPNLTLVPGTQVVYADAKGNKFIGKNGAPAYVPGLGDGGSSAATSSVNQSALNKAVEAAMAQQQAAANKSSTGGLNEAFGGLLKPFNEAAFNVDPGYAFRMEEGNKGLERALAAQGKTLDPRAQKALAEFNQGLASQEYQNAYSRYGLDQANIFNRLAQVSGMGQNATGQITGSGTNYANQSSDLATNLANVNMAASQKSGGSLFDTLLNYGGKAGAIYSAFSDIRLKKDISHLGEVEGVNVYEFRYINDPYSTLYRGCMAQDILHTHPEAVSVADNGYMMVDYDLLPVKMEVVCH